MKKVIALFCILLLLSQGICFVAADTPTIVAADVTGAAGNTVEVTVRFENNPGLISAKVRVGYDATALEFVEADKGDFPAEWYSFGNPEKNPFVVNFCNGTAEGNYAAQLFATLRFKIREDAAAGTYPVTLTCDFEGDFYNYDWDAVHFAIDEGSVTVAGTGDNKPAAKPTDSTSSPSDTPAVTGGGTTQPTASGAITAPDLDAATKPATTPQTETTAKQDAPAFPWVITAVGIAAVLVIAGTVLVVAIRKKRR